MSDWRKIVGTVAPALATALGGPFAGIAVQAIGSALGIDKATEESIAQKIAGCTPSDLLKIKEAENNFAIEIEKLQREKQRIDAEDRNSARNRQIQLKDRAPDILAVLITVGFFGVLAYLLKYGVPKEGGEALLVMLGALGAAWGAVVNYYFGSSSGSAQKTELLARAPAIK